MCLGRLRGQGQDGDVPGLGATGQSPTDPAAGRFLWGRREWMEPMGLGCQVEQAVWGQWQGVKACWVLLIEI